MERVIFVVEATGARIPCMLNPEGLEFRRTSGVHSRGDARGRLSRLGDGHDPLLATGGGRTELQLDLLFDLELIRDGAPSGDVRDQTRPFWKLSEGRTADAVPSVLRFVWGRAWNLPGVIVALSERLDRFRSDGVPTRSWLRVLLVQVDEATARRAREAIGPGRPTATLGTAGEA